MKRSLLLHCLLFTLGFAEGQETPQYIGQTKTLEYGAIGNRIYGQKSGGSTWTHLFTLPFPAETRRLSVYGNEILYSRKDDSIFYFGIDKREVHTTTAKQLLREFFLTGVEQIAIEQGTSGCFHYAFEKNTYSLVKGVYELTDRQSEGMKGREKGLNSPQGIPSDMVRKFQDQIPSLLGKQVSIKDLEFDSLVYRRCRQDILQYKKAAQHLAALEKVKTIDQATLNKALSGIGLIWSTTSFWKQITLINGQGQKMEIRNRYEDPNAFYFPWDITFCGYTSRSLAIEIARFANTAFPGFLEPVDKMPVLSAIVERVYEDQQKRLGKRQKGPKPLLPL